MNVSRGWGRLVVPIVVGVTLGMLAVSLIETLGQGIGLLKGVLWPLAMALLIAYILDPLVSWLARRGWPRLLNTTLLFIVGYALLVLLLIWLIPRAFRQVIDFAQGVPGMIQNARAWLAGHEHLNRWLGEPITDGATASQELAAQLRSMSLFTLANRGLAVAGAGLEMFFYALSLLVLMPLYTFVFLWRFDRVKSRAAGWLPHTIRPRVIEIAGKMDAVVAAFFRGRLVVCIIVGALTATAWSLIGLPFALLLGALAGLANLVPLMATFVALPIAVAVALLLPVEGTLALLTLTVLSFTIVQALDAFVLTPAIQGRASGLHPVTVVVVLLIGAAWMGVLGLLLAIPVTAAGKVLFSEWVGPKLRHWLHTNPPNLEPPPRDPENDEQATE